MSYNLNTNNKKEKASIPTWEELLESMEQASSHPSDTQWNIYRYLSANMENVDSQIARTLLASYMKIPSERPSLIHSMMLSVALKMSDRFSDFVLPNFLKLWGYPQNLRDEDRNMTVAKDGRQYLSLKERTERQLQSYLLHHPDQRPGNEMSCIRHAIAVKVFLGDKERNTRSVVKLVGVDGEEYVAVPQMFPCKPWEIQGGVFDLLIYYTKEGVVRVREVVPCLKPMAEIFPVITGFVEHVDESHGHYHVYDYGSRHFVAEKPKVRARVGDFVSFVPVVPKDSKFKSAIIISVPPRQTAMCDYGFRRAKVNYVDKEKGYAAWELQKTDGANDIAAIKETGVDSPSFHSGFISQNVMEKYGMSLPSVNDVLNIIVFLKRGGDGLKRPYVVYYEKVLKA